jgi:hypothetical protein
MIGSSGAPFSTVFTVFGEPENGGARKALKRQDFPSGCRHRKRP